MRHAVRVVIVNKSITLLTLLHSELSISEGMTRPFLNFAEAAGEKADVIIVGDSSGANTLGRAVTKIIYVPPPKKNPAVDFLRGVIGKYSVQRKHLLSVMRTQSQLVVGYRASPFAPRGAILLKSDLFSANYRRRVAFCLRNDVKRVPVECCKLVLAMIQEAIEFRKFAKVLLHSEVERKGRRRAVYLPIITEAQTSVAASQDVLENGKVLVVGYQFSDPIANADTDMILKQIISKTADPRRIFYLGAKTPLLPDDQQTNWVDDYEAFLRSFSVAVYARSVCSGAHNKLIDLLRNGSVVYCVPHMANAFATRCPWLLPLETYKDFAVQEHAAPYDADQFRRDVDQFFKDEASRYRNAVELLVRG